MKKIFSFVMFLCLLASCKTNDVQLNEESKKESEVKGPKSEVTLKINSKDLTFTRSLTSEDFINDLHIYVFNENKKLESITDLTSADIEAMERTETGYVQKILTSNGQKYFIVTANGTLKKSATEDIVLGDADSNSISIEQVKNVLNTIDGTAGSGDIRSKASAITTLQMVGYAFYHILSDKPNRVEVLMERLAAKVDVKSDATSFASSVQSAANCTDFTIDYTVCNVPKQYKLLSYDFGTPAEGTEGRYEATKNPLELYIASVPRWQDLGSSPHKVAKGFDDDGFVYIPENRPNVEQSLTVGGTSFSGILKNEISYLRVCVTITGATYSDGTAYTAGQNLYLAINNGKVVRDSSNKIKWFKSSSLAAAAGPQVFCFTGGKLYYRADLANNSITNNERDKYTVKRNTAYQVNLKQLRDFDLSMPVTAPKYLDGGATELNVNSIFVDIVVQDWAVVNTDAYL